MSFTKRITVALVASLGSLAAAQAADYDPPIYVEQAAEYVPVEIGSGWYLRGDVGYVFSASIGGVDYTTYDSDTTTYSPASFTSEDIKADFAWGGGFGYRFTDYFRADATVDGYRASFSGSTASDEACAGVGDPNTTCRSENSSEVSTVSVMANGYVDLGTYVGLTPYVGAGAGFSFVSWGDLNDTTYCVEGGGTCPDPLAVGSTVHGGDEGWRFTYALMAGFAYDVTRNFKVDVGYKYRSIDGGDMFGWDSPRTFGDGSHGNLDTHEVRVGVRYELW